MQPFQCDLQPQLQETHRTTHTGSTIVAKHIEGTKRPQPQPPHTRGTFHRRLQPLYTEKHKVSCSGFLPNSPLPFLTAPHRHHFPSSPPSFVHFPSSPLPFLTTSHRPHLPSSPFPFIITSLRHHFPSSPLPFVTTSLRHHFPSSPLPFVTTSLRHHFPSSPPVIITTLHQSQFHCFLFFCYVLLCYVLLCDLPPCIISSRRILFVRNTEVLLPNFLWLLGGNGFYIHGNPQPLMFKDQAWLGVLRQASDPVLQSIINPPSETRAQRFCVAFTTNI